MSNDQQGSTLSDQEKIKGRQKQYIKNLHKKDKRMADIFEEDSSEEGPIILESQVKASLKVLGRNKLAGVGGIAIELFQVTEIESDKILTRIHQ